MKNFPNIIFIPSIFVVALFIFTIGLTQQEIIGFEARFYLFAQEMLRAGVGFFPTTYGEPYPDYTAASTILIYLCAKIFGGLDKFTAVLPSAITAALTVTITYCIGALNNKRYGFHAALLLLLTFAFFKSARTLTLDVYPALITVICFYLVYAADLHPKRAHNKHWIYFFLLLGFIFRGPIGLVIPTGVILSYFLLDGRWKKALTIGINAFLLLILCTSVLLAMAYATHGKTFMQAVLHMQILGRINNVYRPIYFYFTDSFITYAMTYLLAWLVLLGVILRREFDKQNLLKLFGFLFIILIGMSIPGDKKPRYILPIAPALALIAATLFEKFQSSQRYELLLQKILRWIFFLIPAIFFVLLEIVYVCDSKRAFIFNIPYRELFLFLFIMQGIHFGSIYFHWRALNKQLNFLLITVTITFCVVYLAGIERINLYAERGRELIVAVEKQRLAAHAQLIFYKEQRDGFPIKYLIDIPQPTQALFMNDAQQLQQLNEPAFIVTREKNFMTLPPEIKNKFTIIANDKISHARVVIFSNQK